MDLSISGRYKKILKIAFPQFETGTETTKKLSRYLGREPEIPKSVPAIRDEDRKPPKLFPLFGNGNSRHFCWELYRSGNSRLCLILFHPLSSSFIFFHPILSSFILFHPPSSSFILFHPLSSSFLIIYHHLLSINHHLICCQSLEQG